VDYSGPADVLAHTDLVYDLSEETLARQMSRRIWVVSLSAGDCDGYGGHDSANLRAADARSLAAWLVEAADECDRQNSDV
jgi:hypothetical protein